MRLTALLCALLAAPAALAGQAVSGVVTDAASSAPVRGALVTLHDERGRPAGEALTDGAGRFLVRAASAGDYRVRVDRIGHQSTTSRLLRLVAGETVPQGVTVAGAPLTLEGITVLARGRCQPASEAAGDVAIVWEEARKSLSSVRLGGVPTSFRYRVRWRSRALHPVSGQLLTQLADSARERFTATPFVSQAAAQGFVTTRGDTTLFNAPDAAVLLSDAFVQGHCLRVTRGEGVDSRLVGLGFEPLARDPDIRGTLWLDGRTAELRYVDFEFTGIPSAVAPPAAWSSSVYPPATGSFRAGGSARPSRWISRWPPPPPVPAPSFPARAVRRRWRCWRSPARWCRSPTRTAHSSPWSPTG